MRKLILMLVVLAAGALSPVMSYAQADVDTAAAEQQAREVADPWLAQLDAGAFLESWQQAAPVFQQGVSAEQWADRMGQTRAAIGGLVARSFARARYSNEIPSAPNGEYVLVEYASQFTNVPAAIESVVLLRSGENWKVAGASIRPAE